MTVAEPMTLLTDYALSAVCFFLGWKLLRNLKGRWWGTAFFSVGLAALAGGTYHGFPGNYPRALWAATEFCAGVASFAMVIAASRATRIAPTFFFWFAMLKFLAFAVFTVGHDDFVYIVVDSAIALFVVATLHAIRGDAAWRWMIGGVALSVAAGGVQAMHLAPHPAFNHNDLYHVMQIAAMWLFYRGARLA